MTISVCIPTYNQAHYLDACIKSVLMQTKLPDEIIVSNDCSTDNTAEILKNLSAENNLIRVIHQPVNLGLTGNSNACLKEAAGDYVVRLSSDDLLMPGYIETLSGLLTRFPHAGSAHCAANEIDVSGKITATRKLFRNAVFEDADSALKASLKGFRVTANILMYRRKALQQVSYLKSAFNFGEDYYLWVDMAANGFGNVYAAETLAAYRVWNDAGQVRQKRKLEEIKGLTSVFDDVLVPAFVKKHWNTTSVQAARQRFAVAQSNCLGFDYYTTNEKTELKKALLNLSASLKTKSYIKLRQTPFNSIIKIAGSLRSGLISQIKKILIPVIKKA